MAADEKGKSKKSGDDLLDWFTVSYRSIYIAVGGLLVLAALGGAWYFVRSRPVPTPSPEATPATTASAKVYTVEGSVQVKKAGRLEWLPATKEMVLSQGDLVRTGSGSAIEIHFFNGATYHMRPESLITIEESSQDAQGRRQRVTVALQSGVVNFQTGAGAPGMASTTISTPVSRTTAGSDAEGNVAVTETGESRIKVFAGEATTETRNGEQVTLKSNEGVTVDAAGKSGPKINLPGAPQLLAPPHEAEISYVNPAVSTTLLAWKPVASAATYHVLVDYSATFARPYVDQRGWRFSSLELRGLEAGKFFWKVAAVDANGVEGNFSEFAKFSVTKTEPSAGETAPPPLNLDTFELAGNILHLKGHTEAGASLTVNGQRVDVQTDGSFGEFITLDKTGKQTVVVRATGINGGANEQKRLVTVPY
jgi:hypothetical protein